MVEAGTVIRAVRNFRGISQETFSRKIGVSVPTLYRLERNNPELDVDTIARACRELGIEFDWATRRAKLPADLPAESLAQKRPGVVSLRLDRELVEQLKALAAAESPPISIERYLADHVAARGRKRVIRRDMPPAASPAAGGTRARDRSGARPEDHERSPSRST